MKRRLWWKMRYEAGEAGAADTAFPGAVERPLEVDLVEPLEVRFELAVVRREALFEPCAFPAFSA